jgi:uncharacterized protein (DUF2267 family)
LTVELEKGVKAVLKVMHRHISPGEMEDVALSLSPSLSQFLKEAALKPLPT